MESITVKLRIKHGRSWRYQEIEIPANKEMDRIVAELHAEHEPALINVLGWQVLYIPGKDLNYLTKEVDPFNAKIGTQKEYQSSRKSYCEFGYNADWTVCYYWKDGDDKPYSRLQVKGDVIS